MKKTLVMCCLLVSLTGAGTADAGILFDVQEVGSDVQMTVTGSLDLAATLGYGGVATNTTAFFWPAGALMTNGNQQADYYLVSGWTGYFGSGDFQTWDMASNSWESGYSRTIDQS